MSNLKKLVESLKEKYFMMTNAASDDSDGSMIKYWEEQTGIDLNGITYTCPHCHKPMKREQLDGSHVVKYGRSNGPQYITPLCQEFNRSRDKKTWFFVPKQLVVPAPK